MKRLFGVGLLLTALAGCGPAGHGQRCNPLQFTSDCDKGYTCVYPTAPNCGVAYCCAVDGNGAVVDDDPHCRPDSSLDSPCHLDLSTASPPDGGAAE